MSSLRLLAEAIARRKTVFNIRCFREASRNMVNSLGGLLKAASTMPRPRSHCGRTAVILGLCNSIDSEVIISDIPLV